MYTLFGWSMAFLPAIAYGVGRTWRRDWPRDWEKRVFFALWLAPAVVYYALIHMGQPGLVLVFLPVLLLWGAHGLVWLLQKASWPAVGAVAGIMLAVNTSIFCFAAEYPLGGDRLRLWSRSMLVSADRYYQDRFEAVSATFAPDSTAILAKNWHHVEYYLPDYPVLPFGIVGKWERDAGYPQGSAREIVATPGELGLQIDDQGQGVVVVFDPGLMAFNESPASVHELPLRYGGTLAYFVLTGDQAFHYGTRSFGIQKN
jgi:hypothetical protein